MLNLLRKTMQQVYAQLLVKVHYFLVSLKVGNILSFGGLGNNVPSFARITEVNTNDVKVTGVTTVTGVASGAIPTSILHKFLV